MSMKVTDFLRDWGERERARVARERALQEALQVQEQAAKSRADEKREETREVKSDA